MDAHIDDVLYVIVQIVLSLNHVNTQGLNIIC